MSTDANAALAWPIEATEPALIGNQLASRKKTPLRVVQLWAYLERGGDLPQAPEDQKQDKPLELLGTAVPGRVAFKYEYADAQTGVVFDYPEAGVWWLPDLRSWCVRPFTGDWLADPLTREEGTETGYMLFDSSGPKPPPLWAHDPDDDDCWCVDCDPPPAGPASGTPFDSEDNEPEDYDGYLTGRGPDADVE